MASPPGDTDNPSLDDLYGSDPHELTLAEIPSLYRDLCRDIFDGELSDLDDTLDERELETALGGADVHTNARKNKVSHPFHDVSRCTSHNILQVKHRRSPEKAKARRLARVKHEITVLVQEALKPENTSQRYRFRRYRF